MMDALERIRPYLNSFLLASSLTGVALVGAAVLCDVVPQAGLYLYGVLIIAFLVMPIRIRLVTDADIDASLRLERERWSLQNLLRFAVPGVIGFVVCSGQFFRFWQSAFGGFSASLEVTYWDWTRYSLSWLLDNSLANAGQIFGWRFASIQPSTIPTECLVLGYNIVLELVLLSILFRLFQVFTSNLGIFSVPIHRGKHPV